MLWGPTCSLKATVNFRSRSSRFLTKSRGLASSPFTEYARTLQSAENPNFDYPFLTNLRLGTPDYTGSSLQVLKTSPIADLSPHSPNSLGSQSTKSCLRNRGLTTSCSRPRRAACMSKKQAFFLLGLSIEQRRECSRRRARSRQNFLLRERGLDC